MKYTKHIAVAAFLGISLLSFNIASAQLRVLRGPEGGTNTGTALAGDVGSCLKVSSYNPLVWTIGSCGSGSGGGGAGTFSTSTITGYPNVLTNYPNNTTDVVTIGATGTSTAKFYFDPNISRAFLSNASSTAFSSGYASSTIGNFGTLTISTSTAGCASITSAGSIFSTGVSCGTGSGGSTFPFTSQSWGNSTTSTIGFLTGGFFTNASSTIGSNLFLPSLSQGFVYTGSNGLVQTMSSSTPRLSWFTNDLATLTATDSSLTFSGSYNGSTARTVGLNLGNTNTWSILQNFNYSSTTQYASFLNASSTNYLGAGLTACNSTTGKLTWSAGQFACGTDFNTGLTAYDAWTHPIQGTSATTSNITVNGNGYSAFGTTTANYLLTLASSTAPQLSFSEGAGKAQVVTRLAGGVLSYATTTVAGTATSTPDFMSVNTNAGTYAGLTIGTSTSVGAAVLSVVNTSGTANVLFAVGTSTATGSIKPNFQIDGVGHPIYSGPNPKCDANCTFVAGNDARFRITTGTTITTTTITFANTWGTIAPVCWADEGSAGTTQPDASSTPTTVVITLPSALTSKDIEVFCDGILP